METVDKQDGEGVTVFMYGVNTYDFDGIHRGCMVKRKFPRREKRAGWFLTEDKAWADYKRCKKLADKKLAKIEGQITNLRGKLDLEVVIGGYRFHKEIYANQG